MDLATGRPVVITRTDELELSGCAELFFVADENSARGLAAQIDRIIADPVTARAKAEQSQQVALREMTWSSQLAEVLAKLS